MKGTNRTRRSLLAVCVEFTFKKRVGTVLNQESFTKYLPVTNGGYTLFHSLLPASIDSPA